MKAAVLVFPGSNCDRDMAVALREAGADVRMVWHKDAEIGDVDLVAVPGGFSFGDYLRCGAIAANSPVCAALKAHVERGGYALGVCNGFQVLCETGLLPGALMRNAGLTFVCKSTPLRVVTADCVFTEGYGADTVVSLPVAHHDGNYFADAQTLAQLRDEDRIAFAYGANFNGSQNDIAGILSQNRRVLGMMPHPERAVDPATGSDAGRAVFTGLVRQLADA
ncbi:phosphoribosylformylglycinamidine synthase subunit PurQ [Salipiger sp. IMCC34102]|uniref:phosphoribosylformylglycinamidine synthase subunit PurQ n=1 Tax=Salipiger sp. IMCC34102 TaxID=2510647 RepID=UPI00101CB568|nr:phosphoribosylformylglycinamidine synthase subunit PurQ [Salipiger sp. IMCC34102]RYH03175.1 phosphoribosylformylglycinamidine synthase subunit PurQ [Salipiger sp. IMCC34102]